MSMRAAGVAAAVTVVLVTACSGEERDRDVALCERAVPAAESVGADLQSGADPGPHLLELRDALTASEPIDADLAAAVTSLAAEAIPAADQVAKDDRVRINRGDFTDYPGRLAQLERSCDALRNSG